MYHKAKTHLNSGPGNPRHGSMNNQIPREQMQKYMPSSVSKEEIKQKLLWKQQQRIMGDSADPHKAQKFA